MNMQKVWTVYRKEIRDTLRDKRTVMMMILVPILLYPLLFTTMGQLMTVGEKKLDIAVSRIALPDSLPPSLITAIKNNEKIDIVETQDAMTDLKERVIHGFLKSQINGDTLQYVIYYDAAIDKSRKCRERVQDVLDSYRGEIREEILADYHLTEADLNPFAIESENIAPPSRMGGLLLGSIIPMLLIVTMFLGAMYPAIDLTAGEKERGTLETILTVPVHRLELMFGKFLTVTTTACITGFLNLASMMFVYALGIVQMGELSKHLEFGITPVGLTILVLSLLPFALFLSATVMSVSLFARSFKEAQNYITPIYMFIMFPSFVAFMPGVEFTPMLALIPIVNISLLFREILLTHYPLDLVFLTFISNTFLATAVIALTAKIFNAESVLFGEGKGLQFSFRRSEIKPASVLQPSNAFLLFASIMLLLFYVGSFVQLKSLIIGILITEWGLILLPVLAILIFLKVNLKSALGLYRPNLLSVIATVFMAIGTLGLAGWIAQIQLKLFPESMEMLKSLDELLNLSKVDMNPLIGYIAFALSPAICEEALFRGVLFSSLKKKVPAGTLIVLIGFLFGLFHMHVFRLVPTAILGALLTYITYRSGSIFPSILGHFLNNGIALTITSFPKLVERIPWLHDGAAIPDTITIGFGIVFAFGILLMEIANRNK